jgi:hypothetical protein
MGKDKLGRAPTIRCDKQGHEDNNNTSRRPVYADFVDEVEIARAECIDGG